MKILALDIGTTAVKAIEIDSVFGRIEIQHYTAEAIVASATTAVTAPAATADAKTPSRNILTPGQIDALRRIIAERDIRYSGRNIRIDRLCVNLPQAWTTTRLYVLPTKDRRTIQSSIGFELEDDIPFSMESIIHDSATLKYDGTSSTIFTGIALQDDVRSLIEQLSFLGLDPDVVTIEPWATSQVLKRSLPKEYEERPVCVIDMGGSQSTIQMFVGADPILSHVCTTGGYAITQAIAQTYNLSFDDAEKAKVNSGFLLTGAHIAAAQSGASGAITPEQRQFSDTISSAIQPIIRDIKQTLMAYKSQYKLMPRAIFITGGSSVIPNLNLYLEEALQLPVFPLQYATRIVGQTLQLSEQTEAQFAFSMGLALSATKVDRQNTINFRKDLLAKKGGGLALNWQTLKRPLQFGAGALAFVYVNLFVQGFILDNRLAKQEELLERSIKSVVGAVSSSVMSNYKASPSLLKSAINKEIAKYKETQKVTPKPQVSGYEVLNKVSHLMPRSMLLDVTRFEVRDGKFKFSGIVDQALNTQKIQKALEDTSLFTELKKDRADEDPKTKKVTFEFTARFTEKAPEVQNVKTR